MPALSKPGCKFYYRQSRSLWKVKYRSNLNRILKLKRVDAEESHSYFYFSLPFPFWTRDHRCTYHRLRNHISEVTARVGRMPHWVSASLLHDKYFVFGWAGYSSTKIEYRWPYTAMLHFLQYVQKVRSYVCASLLLQQLIMNKNEIAWVSDCTSSFAIWYNESE